MSPLFFRLTSPQLSYFFIIFVCVFGRAKRIGYFRGIQTERVSWYWLTLPSYPATVLHSVIERGTAGAWKVWITFVLFFSLLCDEVGSGRVRKGTGQSHEKKNVIPFRVDFLPEGTYSYNTCNGRAQQLFYKSKWQQSLINPWAAIFWPKSVKQAFFPPSKHGCWVSLRTARPSIL